MRASAFQWCIFSVDVEDWFHLLELESAPAIQHWARLPSRVERNFYTLLDLFAARGVHVTCFFLGWIAERYPHLVREAVCRGHEIASHGYAHRLVYRMTPAEFRADAVRAKRILEDAAGTEVLGYRAAGFSVTPAVPWFFQELLRAEYGYDASIFPARRAHGGWAGGALAPYRHGCAGSSILEFPVTVTTVFRRRLCLFGGGYLRAFPLALIRTMAHRVLRQRRPVVFYVHPRDIDPDHPRLPMPAVRRLRSYVNLRSTKPKIERLLEGFQFRTFRQYIERHWCEYPLAGADSMNANDIDREPVLSA